MMPLHPQQKIVLASGNAGKVREIQALLPEYLILPQAEFAVQACAEPACTFVENALLKARNAASQTGLPAIADDSGLMVDVLGGSPGVLSARYAGEDASDQDNVNKLLQALDNMPENQRTARFVCVMVCVHHADDPCPLVAYGFWEGIIATHPSGDNGFGYDPVFWLAEQKCTAAQLTPDEKNSLSHRGQAVRQLAAILKASA